MNISLSFIHVKSTDGDNLSELRVSMDKSNIPEHATMDWIWKENSREFRLASNKITKERQPPFALQPRPWRNSQNTFWCFNFCNSPVSVCPFLSTNKKVGNFKKKTTKRKEEERRKHMKCPTLKLLCKTRWECRVQNIMTFSSLGCFLSGQMFPIVNHSKSKIRIQRSSAEALSPISYHRNSSWLWIIAKNQKSQFCQ